MIKTVNQFFGGLSQVDYGVPPDQVSDLEIWFDANGQSNFNFYPEGGISTWYDKSGNFRHANNFSSSLVAPIYDFGTTIQEGAITTSKKMLVFNGGRDLRSPEFFVGQWPITIFMISRVSAGTHLAYGRPDSFQPYISFRDFEDGGISYSQRNGGGEFFAKTPPVNPGGINIFEGVSAADDLYRIAVNGGAYVDKTDLAQSYNNLMSRFTIGKLRDAGNVLSVAINTPIAEICMYSKILTESERAGIIQYFKTKWRVRTV